MLFKKKKLFTDIKFGKLLVGLGLVGFLASTILSYEKYSVALDPDHTPSCSISPIVACESVLESGADAIILGIPNAFFGMAAFTALITVGVTMIAGAKFKDWFWKLFYGATVAGAVSVLFFLYQSLFVVNSLCIYCMTTWLVVIALALYSSIYLVDKKLLKLPKFKHKVYPTVVENHIGILILIYIVIYAVIGFRFDDILWGRYLLGLG